MATNARAGQVCQKMRKKIPAAMRLPFQIFRIFFVSNRILKKICTSVGNTTMPKYKGRKQGKCFGKSQRVKKLSFCCLHGKYRKKTDNGCGNGSDNCSPNFSCCLINYIQSVFYPGFPYFQAFSKCRRIFSTSTMPISTITPMAMAIPERQQYLHPHQTTASG